MASWFQYLARAVDGLDRGLDGFYRLGNRFDDALVAFPYLSYGRRERLYVLGRVLEARDLQPAEADASLWENLKNVYWRFSSDEVPGARVRVRLSGVEQDLTADEEGYFEGWLELPEPLPEEHAYLQSFELELLSPVPAGQLETRFQGSAIVPGSGARFGVISDMDDTVLQTGATSILSMAKKVLFGNARTRLPFEGVSTFYQALHREVNPIFYVSSSPWNLYDLLVEFLDINGVPAGPLLLRDWGAELAELLSHGEHKLGNIERILATYPELDFILIGDSGQEDPEIYSQVLRDYPGRILDIYIRDVSEDAERDREIQKLAEAAALHGAHLELVPDTVTAARRAAEHGYIAGEAIASVAAAKVADEEEPKL